MNRLAVVAIGAMVLAVSAFVFVGPTPYAADSQSDDSTVGPDGSPETTTEPSKSAQSQGSQVHADYESTTVTITTADGATLGTVEAAIADTPDLRYTGLSETAALPEDRGMLFVYDEAQSLTFVMREMDFGIDIVFIASNGTITAIHHAPEPGPGEDGSQQRYEGHGQYVLEVNYEWTSEHNVTVGDDVQFDR